MCAAASAPRRRPCTIRSGAPRARTFYVAVEAGTGWLFVCEALDRGGRRPHLAEPVETSALRGNKHRAKTDREDARWLRTLLCKGRLPEAWIPPAHVREWRTRARLRKTLVDERTRVAAASPSHAVPSRHRGRAGQAAERPGPRVPRHGLELTDAASERIAVALSMIEALDRQLAPLERELRQLARRQTGCRALMAHYGIGELAARDPLRARRRDAPVGLPQGGPLRRPRRRRAPLRPPLAGRQADPPGLAAAALGALRVRPSGLSNPGSPDRADYLALKARGLSHTRASLTIARKLARRCFHTLREFGPDALEPLT